MTNLRRIFYKRKLIYDLKTPFKKKITNLNKTTTCYNGHIFISGTDNNVFITATKGINREVISSFSSKMFKDIQGKKQSRSKLLCKKLGFVAALKSYDSCVFDLIFCGKLFRRKKRWRYFIKGIQRAGMRLHKYIFLVKRAHNGCRYRIKRRK